MIKRFIIVPDGIIKGGRASYNVDPNSGVIDYECEVDVKIFLFTQTKEFKGRYTVNPETIRFRSYDEVGETQVIGNIEFKVLEVGILESKVAMRVLDTEMSGIAFVRQADGLDIIEVTEMTAEATVMGMRLNLKLEEAFD